ncbi:MAG: GlxA family transcriptional regulator [Alphaproteobacteria bacterium]|nr:GlxA family transcriptional regulator [Alphaproteobacteria bacterium]
MFAGAPAKLPQDIGFYLVPQFSMMGFAAAIEPLRSANRMSGKQLYRWRLISRDGKPVLASNGIAIPIDLSIADAQEFAAVAVCAGLDVERFDDRAVFAWLQRLSRHGAAVGAISTGAFVLARAGLLDGHRCTLHWESLPAFREAFAAIAATDELFEIDRDRFTCSGGTAAMDMMLHLIRAQHGHELAAAVSEQFIHGPMRAAGERQRLALPERLGINHPKLLAVVAAMEANLEEPVGRAELARKAGLSPRQIERLFEKYLGARPMHYYQTLRLNRARRLLLQTDLSILEVGLACGFKSASHFSKSYRESFNRSPREERLIRRASPHQRLVW